MASRRDFVKFMGRTGLLAATVAPFIKVTGASAAAMRNGNGTLPFTPLPITMKDDVVLPDGFNYHVILSWGDKINATETFGFGNDYTAFFPINGNNLDGVLWVNHEGTDPYLVSNYDGKSAKTKEQVDAEMLSVGGALVRIKLNPLTNKWEQVVNDKYNRRISAKTPIPFAWHEPIDGSNIAIGTMGNCAGGVTPWNTLLTCEEGFDGFWGDVDEKGAITPGHLQWEKFNSYSPLHYGWVVEVDPFTGKSKKLVSLGRFAHEAAVPALANDGRCVVYTGDDANDECLYKFISDKPGNLEIGTLYVANFEKGEWVSMDIEKQDILKANFKSQTDVLLNCRKAAHLVGGSKLDRPEDIEIDPVTNDVFITLSNNNPKGNYHGTIVRITEEERGSLKFKSSVLLTGGKETGLSSPDNIAFDKKGNLWFTTDISGTALNTGDPIYAGFGNNSLFYVPMSGPDAGKPFRVASGPMECEFTGPAFSPDFKTLFLSVQHPGETSGRHGKYTSNWPNGGSSMPKCSVIGISGPALDALMA
jgi:secreted PhoX family phosphatase